MKTVRYEQQLYDSYRLISPHLFGALGSFAYEAFDWINENYFGGNAPETLILWDITDYGSSLGWCRSSQDGPPIIKIHPSTVSPGADGMPWSLPPSHLGFCYAFDVLIHEMIHANINYNDVPSDIVIGNGPVAPRSMQTIHNCPSWVNECNRVGALMGLKMDCQMTRMKRVDGKPQRVNEGNCDPARFPHSHPDRHEFYLAGRLPFAPSRANSHR